MTVAHLRPTAVHDDSATPQWYDDTCPVLGAECPDVTPVVGAIRSHLLHAATHVMKQSWKGRRIGDIAVSQVCRDDPTFGVHSKVELAPACVCTCGPVFRPSPLSLPEHLQTGSIDDEMDRSPAWMCSRPDAQRARPPRHGRVVRHLELNLQESEQGPQQALGLSPGKSEDQAKLKRQLDRRVGVSALSTAATVLNELSRRRAQPA